MAKAKPAKTDTPDVTADARPEKAGGAHNALAGKSETGGRRVDPPGQVDNPNSHRPEFPPGHEPQDEGEGGALDLRLRGTNQDDALVGAGGADSLSGRRGDDTLTGEESVDQLSGGQGLDTFVVGGPFEELEHLDRVLDFASGEDTLDFAGDIVATEGDLATDTAADFQSALTVANAAVEAGAAVVAVQLGGDVVVFADTDGSAGVDAAILLIGRTLRDVGPGDFG